MPSVEFVTDTGSCNYGYYIFGYWRQRAGEKDMRSLVGSLLVNEKGPGLVGNFE